MLKQPVATACLCENVLLFLFGIVRQAGWYVGRTCLFALTDDGMAGRCAHLSL